MDVYYLPGILLSSLPIWFHLILRAVHGVGRIFLLYFQGEKWVVSESSCIDYFVAVIIHQCEERKKSRVCEILSVSLTWVGRVKDQNFRSVDNWQSLFPMRGSEEWKSLRTDVDDVYRKCSPYLFPYRCLLPEDCSLQRLLLQAWAKPAFLFTCMQ